MPDTLWHIENSQAAFKHETVLSPAKLRWGKNHSLFSSCTLFGNLNWWRWTKALESQVVFRPAPVCFSNSFFSIWLSNKQNLDFKLAWQISFSFEFIRRSRQIFILQNPKVQGPRLQGQSPKQNHPEHRKAFLNLLQWLTSDLRLDENTFVLLRLSNTYISSALPYLTLIFMSTHFVWTCEIRLYVGVYIMAHWSGIGWNPGEEKKYACTQVDLEPFKWSNSFQITVCVAVALKYSCTAVFYQRPDQTEEMQDNPSQTSPGKTSHCDHN